MRVAPGAVRLAAVPILLGAVLIVPAPLLALALAGAGAAILWFHRDPDRSIPPQGTLAPADGRIRSIETDQNRVQVVTFLNLTDVHVIRAPVAGTVINCEYTPGGHRPAFSKSSEHNERLAIDIKTEEETYTVVLIAGAVARRIHSYVKEGETVARGERIGHISFGSRVDVFLPPTINQSELAVATGNRVQAGQTVLWQGPEQPPINQSNR